MIQLARNLTLALVLAGAFLLPSMLPDAARADSHDPTQPVKLLADGRGARSPDVHQVIVKFRSDVRGASSQVHTSMGATLVHRSVAGRFDVVRVPEGRTVDELVREYMASGLVQYAEPDYSVYSTWTPDDPLYPLQWHFRQVKAEAAWDIQLGGSPDVIVAVLDTGVAYENNAQYVRAPDLAGTSFVPGWDFVNNDAHPNDDEGHGTHVTGTIAQTTNNGVGVAGLAFGVSIMPVKVLGADGKGNTSTLADGIYYAVDNGAKVLNLSLGGSGTNQTLSDAIAYAHQEGVVVVCSAGNEYEDGNPPQYPAAYATTIAVGATRYDLLRAYYSNTGSYVDIVAPGGDVSVDQNGDGQPDGVLQQTFAKPSYAAFNYWYYAGTSMAAPHVSAAAALLLSANPNLDHEAVRFILESTAVDLGVPGWDEQYGHGLLDVAAALQMSVTVPEVTTNPATAVTGTAATLHGSLDDYGWEECQYSFQYGTQQGGPYAQTDWSSDSIETGDDFSESLSALPQGETFFFRALARNSAGIGYGDERSFTTIPDGPTSLEATPNPDVPYYRIDLTWVTGEGAAYTRVVASTDGYPDDPTDGVLVYEGVGTSWTHAGLTPLTRYFYRAWSGVDDAQGEYVWSVVPAEDYADTSDATLTGGLSIELQPGWNMVSVPLILPDDAIGAVFPGAVAVYAWDAAQGAYGVPETLDPSLGYWVAVLDVTQFDYVGVPVVSWSVPLESGWSLVGSVYGGSVDFSAPDVSPGGAVLGFCYVWDSVGKTYSYRTALEPGSGHWVAVTATCALTVEYAG